MQINNLTLLERLSSYFSEGPRAAIPNHSQPPLQIDSYNNARQFHPSHQKTNLTAGPSWITPEMTTYFASNNGLNPYVSVNSASRTLSITMKKEGLDADSMRHTIRTLPTMYRTEYAELSVPLNYENELYFFIVMKAGPLSIPAVTKVLDHSTNTKVDISWTRIDKETARRIITANKSVIGTRFKGDVDAYITGLFDGFIDTYNMTSTITGSKRYDEETGYYSYTSQVISSGSLGTFFSSLRPDVPICTALKDAYMTLDEPSKAGSKGSSGATVTGRLVSGTQVLDRSFTVSE